VKIGIPRAAVHAHLLVNRRYNSDVPLN
jgi:hypothetical protein